MYVVIGGAIVLGIQLNMVHIHTLIDEKTNMRIRTMCETIIGKGVGNHSIMSKLMN